tara:strand:+ start:1124 stop:1735 length:612 start_codon:yes stop_codon:yes gene_type:complete
MKLLLENWHNFIEEGKKTKEEEEFKPHMMYDPETGEAEKAKTYDRHLKLKNMGWGHDKPKVDEKKNKEGKEQGADGKACWKGYKHAGTEGGKDQCVKMEQIKGSELKQMVQEELEALLAEKKSAAWQRKAGKNKEGGLNKKGRESYEKENPGSDLKAPTKEKGNPRRKSFCARMTGMKKKNTSAETANDPDSRINKSLRKWDC